jgi:3-methylfumaryl-CoA hydratase
VQRRSTIRSVQHKAGRSGELLFVLVEQFSTTVALEEHDIVYRAWRCRLPRGYPPLSPAAPTPQKPPLAGQAWSRTIVPDDVLLFRYSALTFNGHRIHYDRQYVTQVEGYPGLIVHGPLIATLLLDLLRRQLQAPGWSRSTSRPCGRPSTCTLSACTASPRGRQDHRPVGAGPRGLADHAGHGHRG